MEQEQQSLPAAICGYPLPGWRLDKVEWSEIEGQPDGWVVSLKREGPFWSRRRSYIAMARSDVGPLEAWDAALQIAARDDCRWALRDTDGSPGGPDPQGLDGEAATGSADD
jgi:hypothetical protein